MVPAGLRHVVPRSGRWGNATRGQGWLGQQGRAPAQPSGKGPVCSTLPPLQPRCRERAAHVDDDACGRSSPLLLLITRQGQLLVNMTGRLRTAVSAELSISTTRSSQATSPQHVAAPGIYRYVPLRGGTELHSAGC